MAGYAPAMGAANQHQRGRRLTGKAGESAAKGSRVVAGRKIAEGVPQILTINAPLLKVCLATMAGRTKGTKQIGAESVRTVYLPGKHMVHHFRSGQPALISTARAQWFAGKLRGADGAPYGRAVFVIQGAALTLRLALCGGMVYTKPRPLHAGGFAPVFGALCWGHCGHMPIVPL